MTVYADKNFPNWKEQLPWNCSQVHDFTVPDVFDETNADFELPGLIRELSSPATDFGTSENVKGVLNAAMNMTVWQQYYPRSNINNANVHFYSKRQYFETITLVTFANDVSCAANAAMKMAVLQQFYPRSDIYNTNVRTYIPSRWHLAADEDGSICGGGKVVSLMVFQNKILKY
ncbi:hypothetical protein HOLleu_40175 [Holothuria leucospilota]|uniref:Uncharacterized protein n=1 Tax=Holothuria leucospilota TaxID=206669 RepID=A0A9Q1BCW6_HOLLE|nr:hypothetical protein HOLleu_40175 [Holothuria leucospilota]